MNQKAGNKYNEGRTAFLRKYLEIRIKSPTWDKLEYLIQMNYANVAIQVTRIFSIAEKSAENKFTTINQDKHTIDFIIEESKLNIPDDFISVSEKGFKHPVLLNHGKNELSNRQESMQDDYFEVMVCRAAIGSTYIFPTNKITNTQLFEEKPELMSKEFDSVNLYDQNESKEFNYKYIIYEAESKCFPEYIVHFKVLKEKSLNGPDKIICELCADNLARKYCKTEDCYLCVSCDMEEHSQKLSLKHIRTEITKKPKEFRICKLHGLKEEIYCHKCNLTLCIDCKVKGDHCSGERLMHDLVRVDEMYGELEKKTYEVDGQMERKKGELNKCLGEVKAKLKDIKKQNDEIQDKIYEVMQNALRELERITKTKMSLLMSDHVELKRQLDQIEWMDTFLKYEYQVLSPNDYLLSFSRNQSLKKQLFSKHFKVSNILPDMFIEGSVTVLTSEQSRKSKANPAEAPLKFDSTLFQKNDSKIDAAIKTRIGSRTEVKLKPNETIKSKNNLLNLSILKHI